MVADPTAPERSRWQAFTGQSGHAWSPHYDDLQPRWAAGDDAADGRRGALRDPGPRPCRRHRLMPSRRDQIKLTDEEQRELLESRADRGRLLARAARLAALDAALVRPARRRDLDLDLRQVPEGEEPRARPARDAADRDRRRVRRAARRPDRGRGGADPRPRPDRRLRQGADDPLQRGHRVGRGRRSRRRSRRRRRSGSRSTSTRSGSRAGTTASSEAPTSWAESCNLRQFRRRKCRKVAESRRSRNGRQPRGIDAKDRNCSHDDSRPCCSARPVPRRRRSTEARRHHLLRRRPG